MSRWYTLGGSSLSWMNVGAAQSPDSALASISPLFWFSLNSKASPPRIAIARTNWLQQGRCAGWCCSYAILWCSSTQRTKQRKARFPRSQYSRHLARLALQALRAFLFFGCLIILAVRYFADMIVIYSPPFRICPLGLQGAGGFIIEWSVTPWCCM